MWSMSSSAIDDMAEVAVTAIESVAAKALKIFTADTVGPTVTGVELDMRLLELTLNFSETVNTSPLDVTEIVVQNSTGRIAPESVQTSTSATASADGLQVVIGLSVADASSIKAAGALATVSTAVAFVTLSNTTISDMNGAAVVSIDDTATMQVDVLVADNIAPSLSQFDLDMNGAQLVLWFSETVRAGTLSVTQLSLQSNTTLGSGGSFTLPSSSTVSTADSATVAVSLSASDANAIKALPPSLPVLCSGGSDTFLVASGTTVSDMQGNGLTVVAGGAALGVTVFEQDSTSPQFLSIDALVPTQKPSFVLVAVFSESVLLSSLNLSSIVIQAVQNNAGSASSYRLTSGAGSISASISTTVTITLSSGDLAAIKALGGVGRTRDSTFVAMDAGGIDDHATNEVEAVAATAALQATAHTVDITPPTLVSFDADLTTNKLTLSFSEDVVLSTFNVTELVLQAAGSSSVVSRKLTAGTFVAGATNDVVVVTMDEIDVDAIKAVRTLAVDNSTTFLSFSEGTVFDYAENAVTEVAAGPARAVGVYTKDLVAPNLVSFDLNMTYGAMSFTFDKVIRATSVNMSNALLQGGQIRLVLPRSHRVLLAR